MTEKEGLTLNFSEDGEDANTKQVGPYEPMCPGDNGSCEYFDYIQREKYYECRCLIAGKSPFELDVCPHERWWKDGHMPIPEMRVIPATESR